LRQSARWVLCGSSHQEELDLKFFKAVLTYVLAFIACMFVVGTALQSWPAGMQMLFAFGVPGFVVWWRSARKSLLKGPSMRARIRRSRTVLVR
jgi:hypothetical protein